MGWSERSKPLISVGSLVIPVVVEVSSHFELLARFDEGEMDGWIHLIMGSWVCGFMHSWTDT